MIAFSLRFPKRWITWEVNPERDRQKAEFTPCSESSATPTPQIALPKAELLLRLGPRLRVGEGPISQALLHPHIHSHG
jgi:hypothetical protein